MLNHELEVTSCKLPVESLKVQAENQKRQFKSMS